MRKKDKQEIMLFADGKPVGHSKDVRMSHVPTEPNGDTETYHNMSEKQCYSISFDMKASEEAKDYFLRMVEEHKEKIDAIRERIESLFKEFCQIGSDLDKEKTNEAYHQLLTLFSIGYRLGWNDYYHLNKEIGK